MLLSKKSNVVRNLANTSLHSNNVSVPLSSIIQDQNVSWRIIQTFLLPSGFLIFAYFTTVAAFGAVWMSGDQRGALDAWQRGQFGSVWQSGSFVPVMDALQCLAAVLTAHRSEDLLGRL